MKVELSATEQIALQRLAHLERRRPSDQAAVIIRLELERRGLLPADTAPPAAQPQAEGSVAHE